MNAKITNAKLASTINAKAGAAVGPQGIVHVAAEWAQCWKATTAARWAFARTLLAYRTVNPKESLSTIGEACAKAVARDKAYGKSWVSSILRAAEAYPTMPKTAEEGERFDALFSGNAGPSKAKGAMTVEERIAMVASLAKSAAKNGADCAAILAAVEEALTTADDADDTK